MNVILRALLEGPSLVGLTLWIELLLLLDF